MTVRTENAEEYLEAIFKLQHSGGTVTVKRLAAELGLTSPSVSEMVHRLRAAGLVERRGRRGRGRGIRLTEAGLAEGAALVRRHRLSERFLVDYLDMPWDVVGPLRARYPRLARRLGIEGIAIAEFEVGADGRAKNINCVDAWPSDVFYEAAREALQHAKFQPKDVHVRFGASYKMPFVFRISGASKARDSGRRARPLRPTLAAAQQAVENLRERAGPQR